MLTHGYVTAEDSSKKIAEKMKKATRHSPPYDTCYIVIGDHDRPLPDLYDKWDKDNTDLEDTISITFDSMLVYHGTIRNCFYSPKNRVYRDRIFEYHNVNKKNILHIKIICEAKHLEQRAIIHLKWSHVYLMYNYNWDSPFIRIANPIFWINSDCFEYLK